MIDHIGLAVRDLERSRAFYSAVLAPLGITLLVEVTAEQTGRDVHCGFGRDGKAFFWIGTSRDAGGPVHVAFKVEVREAVDAFFRAALLAGGTDNGAPGLRPHYHPDYYGVFVLDPDHNNVEAVCHRPT